MRLAIILLVVALLAGASSFVRGRLIEQVHVSEIHLPDSAGRTASQKQGDRALPLIIGGDARRAIALSYEGQGQALTLDVRIAASHERFELLAAGGSPQPLTCGQKTAGGVLCKARVHLGDVDHRLFLTAGEPVTIERVDTKLLAAKRVAQTGNIPVPIALCGLVLLAPIFWFATRRASHLAMVAIAAGWFTLIDWRFALLTFLVLIAFYFALSAMTRRQRRGSWFLALLAGAVATMALVKVVLPLSAGFFANPGELFLLPLGFSYFVIRIIDLAFKGYARQVKDLSLLEYLAYMLFPPTLAAGPVMTLPQFRSAAGAFPTLEDRTEGLMRILLGIAKKLAADAIMFRVIAPGTAHAFFGPSNDHVPVVLLANVAFVFLDFSAYSDMAIGVGRCWGWKVPENFNWPLVRRNMREFWQNWHMSVTQWATRCVHLLAHVEVRRAPRWMQVALPTFATLLTIGLWHGFELVWVLWAMHHTLGILLGDEVIRLARSDPGAKALATARLRLGSPAVDGAVAGLGILYVWVWVALSGSFTTTSSVHEALDNYLGFLTLGQGGLPWPP